MKVFILISVLFNLGLAANLAYAADVADDQTEAGDSKSDNCTKGTCNKNVWNGPREIEDTNWIWDSTKPVPATYKSDGVSEKPTDI